MKTKYLVLLLLLPFIKINGQVSLTLIGRQPYPIIATNYLSEVDIITATVKNQSNSSLNLKAFVTINGPYNITIASEMPTCNIELEANEIKRFDRFNYEDLCLSFDEFKINNILYQSTLSAAQKEALIVNRILPEGTYTYCMTLKNASSNAEVVTTCIDLNINHPDRPTIITPRNEVVLDGNQTTQLNISWSHIINDIQLRQGTSYNVKIVWLGDNEAGDYQFPSIDQATIALDDPALPPMYEDSDISYPFNLSTLNLLDYPFENNHYYALRVTVINDEYPYPVESSQSNVHIFMYDLSDVECGQSFEALEVYPQQDQIIPFTSFANIIKMQPYCDSYKSLNYISTVKNANNSNLIKEYKRKMSWKDGPRVFFINYTGIADPEAYYSSHISFGDYNDLPVYERGEPYYWKANGEVKIKSKLPFEFLNIPFEVGMPAMKPNSPGSGETVSPGSINLGAVHDNVPTNPLPPFKVIQIIDEEHFNYGDMAVKEMAVIQVSDTLNFSNIIYAASQPISAVDAQYLNGATRIYNQSEFIRDVYKPMNVDVQILDFGTYYWRVAWMKNPSTALSEEEAKALTDVSFYHMNVDSFVIGEPSATTTTTESTPPQNGECYTPCQLPTIANTNNINTTITGGTLKIGKFQLEIENITKAGSLYSGTGKIKIPFIREINLEVVFTNVKINTDTVIYEGSVLGKQGGNELESLNSMITGQDIELPFGVDTKVKDVNLVLAFTDFTFAPTHAFAEVNFDTKDLLSLLEPSNLYPILSTQICVSPGGYENDLIFHSTNDLVYQPTESGYGFEIRGGQNLSDTSSMTYFRFDCDGFNSMQLSGAIVLSQDIFLKDSGLTTDDKPKNEAVKGEFKAKYVKDQSDLMLSGIMADFQFADYLEGWGFDVDTFYIDLSDTSNPPNFEAPEGYSPTFFNNPATANTWKGLYIPKIKVLSPKDFVNPNRSTFGVTSMIMGDGIYYLRHRMFNVVDEGIMGRMKATVDTVDAVVSNVDFRFKVAGKLLLPFVEEGGYLAYSGLYNEINEWNFILKVGTDSLEVDLWKAYLRIYENSYFLMGRDTAHDSNFFIKTLVNGYISIDDDLLPSGGSHGLKNIKLPRVEFENLGYESKVGFLGGAVFRKASPQKNINGFPIQLDSIAFTTHLGNPGLYIEPKVVLSGEEDGFSGSAGIIFYGKFTNTSPLDVFSDIDIFLSEINIDVAVASCTFKGYIHFIEKEDDKGFEGLLDATFPAGIAGKFVAKFGHAGSNTNTNFNTAENYNYWYVDALIAFGKEGIPMFAGVNLFGIGGGMWHNMDQDSTFKIKPSALYTDTPTPPSTIKNSPIPYSKKFGGGYGIKMQGLFGDAAGGDKLNMLLALSAQFPESGGPIIKLRGDVNIMSKISDLQDNGKVIETKKSLWGFAELEYNGQEDFIHAALAVNAKITVDNKIILQGKSAGYKVVDAQFHANTTGSSEWYLFVGTPDQRGGIKITLGPADLEANSYFMMGHGVPSVVPEPDAEFMAMLENQQSGYTSSGGSVQSILNKQINLNANGIAFGGVIKYSNVFRYQPFYLDIRLIVGIDINFSESNRECLETGEIPGHNEWYGTGQLYAGLSGEFGIHIDLWFIECDKTIFNGSVATLMSGGLPNPSWFKCRGTLRYDIAGLIKGSHSFEMQVGESCTIGNGNPFSDMEIITDTSPKQNENNVSIFTEPTVSYAFPVNDVLEFYDDKINEYVFYRLLIHSYTLNTYNYTPAIDYSPTINLIDDNFISAFKPNTYLIGEKSHKMKVVVKALKKIGNGAWFPYKEGNVEWKQDTLVTFRTDKAPDFLTPEQIELSYPLQGQQYFLKGETENDKGFIYLTNSFPEMFYTIHPTTSIEYKYVMEFTPIPTNSAETVKAPAEILANRNIRFNVNQLANNTAYYASLKREQVPSMVNGSIQNLGIMAGTPSVSTYKKSKIDEYNYEVLPAKMISFGGNRQSVEVEKTLFKFIFKTSKFTNFKEKLDALTWVDPVFASSVVQDISHKIVGHTEDFDTYDINGYQIRVNNNNITHPLINAGVHYVMGESFGNNDFDYLGNDPIIDNVRQYYFFECQNYMAWRATMTPITLRNTVNHLTRGLDDFNYVLSLQNLVKLNYNKIQGLLTIPQSNVGRNGFAINQNISGVVTMSGSSSGPPQTAPSKTMTLRVNYWQAGFVRAFFNKSIMADHVFKLSYIMKENNINLFNQLTTYINSPTNFYVDVCKDTKVGLVYKIPQPGNYTIKTRITKNYKTPGSCEIPNID